MARALLEAERIDDGEIKMLTFRPVADLTEACIAKMEDVLEVYERPYDPQEPIVCLDEKPVWMKSLSG
jgi:hypothetical protein